MTDNVCEHDLMTYFDDIVEQKPYISILLNAFRPIFIERLRFLQLMADRQQTFPLDTTKFQGGVPLDRQFRLFSADDPWPQVATSAARAIAEGFPALKDDMKLLEEQIETGILDCYDFYHNLSSSEDDLHLMTWAVKCSVSTAALGLFLKTMERFILSKRAADMKEALAPLPWDKGTCPVCSSMPMLAITREQGQQWLQCSRCGHEWKFARLSCPSCNHKSPEDTTYFYVDGAADEKAFVCDNCQSYLITVNQGASLQATPCPEALAISLTHLDLIMQGKGYNQMALCDWNTL